MGRGEWQEGVTYDPLDWPNVIAHNTLISDTKGAIQVNRIDMILDRERERGNN